MGHSNLIIGGKFFLVHIIRKSKKMSPSYIGISTSSYNQTKMSKRLLFSLIQNFNCKEGVNKYAKKLGVIEDKQRI